MKPNATYSLLEKFRSCATGVIVVWIVLKDHPRSAGWGGLCKVAGAVGACTTTRSIDTLRLRPE